MRVYQAVWRTWTALAGLVGTVMCLAASDLLLTVVLFVTIASCAGVIAGNLLLLEERPQPRPWSLAGRVVELACCAGAAGVAVYGFAVEIGTDMLMLAAVLGCSSPVVVAHALRLAGVTADEPSSRDQITVNELAQWSDAALYAVWCTSRTAIGDAGPVDQVGVAVEARQELLAEFERRHPDEAADWLTSGAGLAGEPPQFLLHKRTH